MSGPDRRDPPDEFGQIAEFFRPLTRGAPGALGLLDDAAILPDAEGRQVVVTQDALVEGVHFPNDADPAGVAARFLRVNLSDLAAKGAEPFAWLQTLAWGAGWDLDRRRAFARALGAEAEQFGLSLLGGDTVTTAGPFLVSGTFFGRCPAEGMVPRAGARPGDLLLVSGPIGDGMLGLKAVTGALADPSGRLAGRSSRDRGADAPGRGDDSFVLGRVQGNAPFPPFGFDVQFRVAGHQHAINAGVGRGGV